MAVVGSSRVIRRIMILALLPLTVITCSLALTSSSSEQPVRLARRMSDLPVGPVLCHGPVDRDLRHVARHQERDRVETQQRSMMSQTTVRVIDSNFLTVKAEYEVSFTHPQNFTPLAMMSDGIADLALSPKDKALFILQDNAVLRMSTNQTSGARENATFVAGLPSTGFNFGHALALEDRDVEGGEAEAGGLANGDTWPTRILHVADNEEILRAFSVDYNGSSLTHRQLYSLNYTTITGGRVITSMAIDSPRRMLYASAGSAIYRANLTYTPGGGGGGGGGEAGGEAGAYSTLEHWIGAKEFNSSAADNFVDSDDPLQVRFGFASLHASGFSPDGETLYFVDSTNASVLRMRTSTGAVDRIVEDAPVSRPRHVAVTQDGCHLFVLEGGGTAPAGLGLITLDSTGGGEDGSEVQPGIVALGGYARQRRHFPLAISPESDVLYVAVLSEIVELKINKSPLRPCAVIAPPPSTFPPVLLVSSSRSSVRTIVIASVGVVVLLLLVALCVVVFVVIPRRRGRFADNQGSVRLIADPEYMEGSVEAGKPPLILRPTWGLKRYSLEEISRACEGFSQERLVGKGGAAEVYKGVLGDGQVVAVKMMKGAEFLKATRFRQFQAEMDVLGSLRHSQICSIVGYCAEKGKSFLVYPFVEGGTLHDRLRSHGCANSRGQAVDVPKDTIPPDDGGSTLPRQKPTLDWKTRLSVARQIASALRYLHHQVDPPVVHRDLKTTNVLLEDHGEGDRTSVRAYLSDFGLAKVGQSVFGAQPAGETVETFHVAGTRGYMAPEYYSSCRLTAKNDVYAFGVLLLELITGRPAFMSGSRQQAEQGKKEEEENEREGKEQESKSTESSDFQDSVEEEEGGKGVKDWESAPQTLARWAKRKLRAMEGINLEDEDDDDKPLRTSTASATVIRSTGMKAAIMQIDRIREIADPRLVTLGPVDWSSVREMTELAMECILTDPRRRPQIGVVLNRLVQLEQSICSRELETG
ncbi:hypothetical protein CBR_g68015 [Chara braunii]|uniref:Protein kinase domain-containing protein n=1 Tax=Chara braunii TaxID=69332 RepID=A0A388MFT6_CHABU|nr:hypothetical protein CBR_g68015 [Chara braunii]|eukprot:GBG93393.1 hypothetical protein CBR_g68015 [Chara braunii]